jgi:hypothetical protein
MPQSHEDAEYEKRITEQTKEILRHLEHVAYPVTGKQFAQACNSNTHIPKEQCELITKNINLDKTYRTPAQIREDLRI